MALSHYHQRHAHAHALLAALERYITDLAEEARGDPNEEHLDFLNTAEPFLDAFRAVEETREHNERQWVAFAAEHPELREPSSFTDEDLLEALQVAIAKWNADCQTSPGVPSPGAVWADQVGTVLLPGVDMTCKDAAGKSRASGQHLRVARALCRLADHGKVIRLRAKSSGANRYTLAGIALGEHTLRYWRIDHG